MLQIINNKGQVLQPDPDTIIPVEVYNPLFTPSGELFQELIYNAQAGLTDHNKSFIGSGHLVETSTTEYELPVQVLYRGSTFFVGMFRYKIVDQKINFELKVNFGTVAKKVQMTVIREIMTMDPPTYLAKELFEKMMKDTCTNPEDYPYAFFPVYNKTWMDTTSKIDYPWMNYWDHAAQKFTTVTARAGMDSRNTLEVPFYKVSYILKMIFEYLNFTLKGEVLSDPEFNSIYLYTRRVFSNTMTSLCYMPDELTIGDLLKQISERLKLNFTYNLITGTVTAENIVTALKVNTVFDITPYVESISELSADEAKGYTVTLVPDSTDKALNLAAAGSDKEVFAPLQTLIVGDGENVEELQISTLKQVDLEEYSYPTVEQFTDFNALGPDQTWPVRLIQFKGMKTLKGGKVFPEATAFDLSEQDATYYRFRNESKKIILNAKIPAGVLATFTPTAKFGFKSKQGTFVVAMNSSYKYSLSASATELVTVKIESQSIVQNFKTPYTIQKYSNPSDLEGKLVILRYKFCYQDGSFPNESFKLEIYPKAGSTAKFESMPANAPCDIAGVGGLAGACISMGGSRPETTGYTFRIYNKVPLYAISSGRKVLFTNEGAYYSSPGFGGDPSRPVIIVF
ncbi:hypothetical protein [Pedobacter antarcticus]|uniref:hypothetical protein n=1 Tax=Pedobacter antarcticus TaxID=34086 RepID=UPI00292EB6BE|nr:hypothetical protein [Pedobacter antarcticus]